MAFANILKMGLVSRKDFDDVSEQLKAAKRDRDKLVEIASNFEYQANKWSSNFNDWSEISREINKRLNGVDEPMSTEEFRASVQILLDKIKDEIVVLRCSRATAIYVNGRLYKEYDISLADDQIKYILRNKFQYDEINYHYTTEGNVYVYCKANANFPKFLKDFEA